MSVVDDPQQILATLKSLAAQERVRRGASLSADGERLTLAADGTVLDARTRLFFSSSSSGGGGNNNETKTFSYSAASVYLQISDPDRLVAYRSACKKHNIKDIVDAVGRPIVLAAFFGAPKEQQGDGAAAEGVEPPLAAAEAAARQDGADAADPMTVSPEAKKSSSKSETGDKRHHGSKEHRHHHHHHKSSSSHRKDRDRESSKRKKDHHHKSSSKHHREESEKKKKAKPTTVTNEELFSNLDVVVGKRAMTDPSATSNNNTNVEDDKAAIVAALSADGFDVTPELLEEHREATQQLLAHEIPVGDSASILRAANPRKDLSRVLEIFNETVNPKKTKPSSSTSTLAGRTAAAKKAATSKSYLVGKKPVIVVPKGMTTPVTMINALEFFSKGRFVPRDVLLKQQRQSGGSGAAARGAAATFTRQLGGTAGANHPGLVEYEITDNPKRLLGGDPKEWERIVAVLVLGHKWQFADWLFNYNHPVTLFTKTFGFFVILEGDKIPEDVKGWAVRHAKLNRDKRGMDSMTSAAFWNGLDEFMSVHKRELLPQQATDS